MIQDIFSTKNKIVDKTGHFQQAFEDVAPNTFVFQIGDEDYAKKRKACAHAFYKDRLMCMLEVLKEKLHNAINTWQAEIESSQNQQTVIDIAVEFEKLLCRNIVHICFGEDVSDMEFDFDVRVTEDGKDFVRKKIKLAEAIHEFDDSVIGILFLKWLNPIY